MSLNKSKSFGRMVKINEILQDNFKTKFGDYINVRVICHKSNVTINDKVIARFIFADGENHISGILYGIKVSPDSDAQLNKLMEMENKIIRLENFRVDTVPPKWRLLRNQDKRLILNNCSIVSNLNVDEDKSATKILKNYPFDFTPIEDLEKSDLGSVFDLIGLCESHNDPPKLDDRNTTLFANTRYNVHGLTPVHCKIEVLGSLKTVVSKKKEVYAFMNLEKIKSGNGDEIIQTTDNTIIVRLTDKNREKLPPNYESLTFIMNLFKKPRGPRKSSSLNAENVDETSKQDRTLNYENLTCSTSQGKEWSAGDTKEMENMQENKILYELGERIDSPKTNNSANTCRLKMKPAKLSEPLKRMNGNCSTPKPNNIKRLRLDSSSQK